VRRENEIPSRVQAAVSLVRRKTAFGAQAELVVAISVIGAGPGSPTALNTNGAAVRSTPEITAENGQARTGALVITAVNRMKTIPAAEASTMDRSRKRYFDRRLRDCEFRVGSPLPDMLQVLPRTSIR
jgi:hypothetical protein